MSSKDDVIRGQEWAGMALVRESERLRGLLEHAEEANGELAVEREELRAENERLREEMAEWESAHAAVTELRGLVESHMNMARGEWECVAQIERLRAARNEAIARLSVFVDAFGGECRFDHHGFCQEHLVTKPCEVVEARRFLALALEN